MFTPIHLVPNPAPEEAASCQDRWQTAEGRRITKLVLQRIQEGAGEDFLQTDFEAGQLGFLENQGDLRGIELGSLNVVFPTSDTFETIDFSYASLTHCSLTNAIFDRAWGRAMRAYACRFVRCTFVSGGCYAATFQDCVFENCWFIDSISFRNCSFRNVQFADCLIEKRLFFDCCFDERTSVSDPRSASPTVKVRGTSISDQEMSEFFEGLHEAYRAGNVHRHARLYRFKRQQCATRYNSRSAWERLAGYFLELTSGYGNRPFRGLLTMLVVYLLFSLAFCWREGISEGILLGAGAFFTFGAQSDSLSHLPLLWRAVYILDAFLGVSSTALFVTLLARRWFSE